MPVVESIPLIVKMLGLVLDGDSPLSVTVALLGRVVLFSAIAVGLNEHVPLEQDKLMVSVKVLGAVRVMTAGVLVTPMGTVCDTEGELSW